MIDAVPREFASSGNRRLKGSTGMLAFIEDFVRRVAVGTDVGFDCGAVADVLRSTFI